MIVYHGSIITVDKPVFSGFNGLDRLCLRLPGWQVGI